MMQRIALLGATGSIGKSTVRVLERYPERFQIHSIACGSQVRELARLAARFHPKYAAVANAAFYSKLKGALIEEGASDVKALAGEQAIIDLARDPEADTIVQAIVGAAGVAPTFAAAQAGKRLLLANKESVVCGGQLLMKTIADRGATLLPVDSEHNAIFQCLDGVQAKDRAQARIWLTCSGGPFRDKPELDLNTVTPEMALAHPTWAMGRKISIDSATLMNKGFEVIEARHLFDFGPERITVLVHPQSVIHSMIEFADGSVIGQMGPTDMVLPIAHCLGYPDRLSGTDKRLDFRTLGSLTFSAPDMQRFPQLAYAYETLSTGGISSIVLNAANEIGVEAFLDRRLSFTGISRLCRTMLDTMIDKPAQSLEDIMLADSEARARSRELVSQFAAQ